MKNEKIITIHTGNILQIINSFNKDIINEDLHNYIMHQCLGLSIHDKITLQFIGIFKEEEKEKIKTALHNYYQIYVEHYKNIDRYDDWIRLFLFIIGFVFIFVSQKFDFVISEFLLVIGWLAIWELGYDILFDKKLRKRNYLRYKQIISSEISFIEKN